MLQTNLMTQLILMYKNSDVNAYNAHVILKSTNTVYTVTAKDMVVGSTPHNMHQKIIQSFKSSYEKACTLPSTLSACIGFHYDLTVNLNTTDC